MILIFHERKWKLSSNRDSTIPNKLMLFLLKEFSPLHIAAWNVIGLFRGSIGLEVTDLRLHNWWLQGGSELIKVWFILVW